MTGIENSNYKMNMYSNDESRRIQLEKEGEAYDNSGVNSDKNEDNTPVTIFSMYDNDSNSTADYKDNTTKTFVDSARNISEDSNLSDAAKKLLNGKLDSIWTQEVSTVSVAYNNVECNIDDVEREQQKLDASLKSEIENQIKIINSKVQEEYNRAVVQAKAKATEMDSEKEEEKPQVDTKKLPVGMGTTTARTINKGLAQINQTMNVVSEVGDYASEALSISEAGANLYKNHLSDNVANSVKKHNSDDYIKNLNKSQKIAKVQKGLGMAGVVLDTAMTGYNAYDAVEKAGGLTNSDGSVNLHAAAEGYREVGRGIGGVAGAAIGSSVGSTVPVVGTFVGGYIGGKIGAEVGADVADAQIELTKIMTNDETSTGTKVVESAKLYMETKEKIAEDTVNVAVDIVGDAAKLAYKYGTPLANVEQLAGSLGLDEVAQDLNKAERLIDDQIDGVTGATKNVLGVAVSVYTGDIDEVKEKINEASSNVNKALSAGMQLSTGVVKKGKKYTQQVGNAVDDGITNVAHSAKTQVKSTLNSVKVDVKPNSNSIQSKAGRIWNSGVETVYETGASTYHVVADGYNSVKKKGKAFLKSLGW